MSILQTLLFLLTLFDVERLLMILLLVFLMQDTLILQLNNLLLLMLILMFSMELDRLCLLLDKELLLLIILKLSFSSNKTTSPELF